MPTAARKKRAQAKKEGKPLEPTQRSIKVRGARNRMARQETLREQMKATEYLRQIGQIDDELVDICSTLKKPKVSPGAHDRCKTRIQALRVRADINFRRLAKVLPDLKSIELTDSEGNNPLGGFAAAVDAFNAEKNRRAEEAKEAEKNGDAHVDE